MNILRLIFLFIIGMFIRRIWHALKRKSTSAGKTQTRRNSPGGPFQNANNRSGSKASASGKSQAVTESLEEITEQEIDDADFEEIP
ncbi:MAG: hypothetical protein GY780_02795 [bacterium]|nr:hypothetical protein [bacterium]